MAASLCPRACECRRKVHDIPPEKLPCPDCGVVRTKIGEEIREQLDDIPASLVVIENVRPKYLRGCPDRS